ncbi:MAG TPA: hypothetical protein PK916_08875 [Bacteroidota bacterium]|nr:hypothetical protein [Bacteroidota bacterium]
MAQERVAALILSLRRLMGDEYERDGNGTLITNALTQNGEWTAQAMAGALVLACRKILHTAAAQLKDNVRLAAQFPEHLSQETLTFFTASTNYSKYELPDDFAYEVTARLRPEGNPTAYRVKFEPITLIDKTLEETNVEERRVPRAFIEGEYVVLALADDTYNHGDTNAFQLRYLRTQPDITVGTGAEDILLRSQWDEMILQFARAILLSFKE